MSHERPVRSSHVRADPSRGHLQPNISVPLNVALILSAGLIGGAPAPVAGAAVTSGGHGRSPVRVDDRSGSRIVEFEVAPSEVRRAATTAPGTAVSGRLVTASEMRSARRSWDAAS